MASIDQLKASDGSGSANLATVQSARSAGALTITVNTVAGFNNNFIGTMGTPHTFTDPVTSETITVISEATAVDFKGHVDGTDLVIDTIAPGNTDLGSEVGDIVIVKPTTQWADAAAEVMEVAHNDDGTLKDDIVAPANRTGGFKVGTIQTATGTGNKSFTGVGFRPKAIIFLGQRTGTTDAVTNLSFWDGTSAQNIRAGARTTATSGAFTGAGTAVVQVSGFASGSESTVVSASGVSMDADGFTLNFVTNLADTQIAYLALA